MFRIACVWGISEPKRLKREMKMEQNIDIKENYIYQLDANLLAILLLDKSSDKNIIWATDNYAERGFGYQSSDQIIIYLIPSFSCGRNP